MARVATCECYRCHHIVPKTEAKSESYSAASGHSFGASTNFQKKNSTRFSGRKYFSKKTRWLCFDCIRADQQQRERDRQARARRNAEADPKEALLGWSIVGGLILIGLIFG